MPKTESVRDTSHVQLTTLQPTENDDDDDDGDDDDDETESRSAIEGPGGKRA